ANCDDLGMIGQPDQTGDVRLLDLEVVRMHAHRSVETRMTFGHGQHAREVLERDGDAQGLLHVIGTHRGNDVVLPLRQFGKVQMTMGIDKHQELPGRIQMVWVGRLEPTRPARMVSMRLRSALPASSPEKCRPTPCVLPPCAPGGVTHATVAATGCLVGSSISCNSTKTSSPSR